MSVTRDSSFRRMHSPTMVLRLIRHAIMGEFSCNRFPCRNCRMESRSEAGDRQTLQMFDTLHCAILVKQSITSKSSEGRWSRLDMVTF
jgi:hypothetical protein